MSDILFINIAKSLLHLAFYVISQLTFTCSKSTLETLEKGVFIVNFEHISCLFSSVSIVDFEKVSYLGIFSSQLTFTCSNLRIETLEKGVKYVQI